jgi:hypothetical protein
MPGGLSVALARELSKTKLSLYLRTQCDRELYLSLFNASPAALVANGVPAPLKSRPNVQLVKGAGQTFETEQYKMLQSRLGTHAHYSASFGPLDLANALTTAASPSACIQPSINVESFRSGLLGNLGLTATEQSLIPKLSGIRPDLVLVRDTLAEDWEITPTGNRRRLAATDSRRALSVVDLKNVTEANASYAAEVCLYAVVLSNWLSSTAFAQHYYVSSHLYLWTRPELTAFDVFFAANPTASGAQLVGQLILELERDEIDFLQFMPSVRKFFKEDVPRVIKQGDAQGWAALDYHVGTRCNACDWLGYRQWLSKPDEALFAANPTHYCVPSAEASHHLSRVPSLSRGARQVLEAHSVKDVPTLGAMPAGSPILSQHTFLKRERRGITRRAQAILTSTLSADAASKINTLSRQASLQISLTVAFDASAGRLSGIGLHASFMPPYGSTAKPGMLARKGLIVARDADLAEWAVIEAFIDTLISVVDKAAANLQAAGHPPAPRAQLYLWEPRQYEELCKAFGRHLARVLALPDSRQRALAWLFPADDLLERDDGAISPAIVFAHEIVERVLHLPVTHVSTLVRVAQYYHHPSLVPNAIDTFYSEPFSNGIPRERTFEIWMNTTGAVSWGGSVTIPLADAMDRYRRVLADNAFALSSVIARLRADFKSAIKGTARPLALSTISGKSGVAFDSKMWSQWKHLDRATRSMELASSLASPGERLESAYKAIVLTKMVQALPGHRYVFEVSAESLESKIDAPDHHLTFGLIASPGFPLETGYSLGLATAYPALTPGELKLPMYRVMRARLESFDRAARRATVGVQVSWAPWQGMFDAVLNAGIVDLATMSIFLMECGIYDDSAKVDAILEAIGDPANAVPDPNAVRALGKQGKTLKAGKGAPCRLSRILWQANLETTTAVRSAAAATAIANRANQLAPHGLNASQRAAVEGAASRALSILWGPPGTGKTDTLAAFVHALIDEANSHAQPRKILLTGPNYRAIEVLAERVFQSIEKDSAAVCDLFRAYSKSRELPIKYTYPAHLGGTEVSLAKGSPSYAALHASLADLHRVTIIATAAHAAGEVAAIVNSSTLAPVFDVVIIDESSQVDVTLALRALATLKPAGQVVIAGDHLQMPPIAIVDPPLNAEYLVGSIQTYLKDRFGIAPYPLTVNYRSNQTIVDYALTLGYPPQLVAHEPTRRVHEFVPRAQWVPPAALPASPAWDTLLDPDKPVCCLLHEDETASQANAGEAKMVAALIDGLFRSMSRELDPLPTGSAHALMNDVELFTRGVGVVTPHKAQRAAVLTELQALFPNTSRDLMADAVDTVERFQGGERHTIIVSFGVGDIEVIQGEEEFLLQLQRINVAVSRAMAKCIVLMPKSLAYHLPSEKRVLKTAKAIKSYIEEFCAQRQASFIQLGTHPRPCDVRWH